MADAHLLFVYGTLRNGERSHPLLVDGNARFAGEALTSAEFELLDLGSYPALIAGGTTRVKGELYWVDEMLIERLDLFEDHPHTYVRTALILADGRKAQVYLHARPPPNAPRIPGGDWVGHARREG